MVTPLALRSVEGDDQVSAWAASGAMALTGPRESALGPPDGFVPALRAISAVLTSRAAELGASLEVDALALLGERAAISGLQRQGRTSCGGATRLLPTADDGWLALSLARPEDVELVPAWLGLEHEPADVWAAVAGAAAARGAEELVEGGVVLGLPVAALPGAPSSAASATRSGLPLRATAIPGPAPGAVPLAGTRVVDFSSLWAGPLCSSLLAAAGADVVKVESTTRPDGARLGPPAFYDLLHSGTRSVALDLRSAAGADQLRDVVAAADVVVEASRPRALEQLGIDAVTALASGRTRVWVSVTGHGRSGPGRERVAFGDDAAVAGGLVSGPPGAPSFCADAVADPASGLVAAAGALDALARGGRWLLDVSMAGVAAHLAGPTLAAGPDVRVAPPRARVAPAPAPPLGAHTAEVLAEVRT